MFRGFYIHNIGHFPQFPARSRSLEPNTFSKYISVAKVEHQFKCNDRMSAQKLEQQLLDVSSVKGRVMTVNSLNGDGGRHAAGSRKVT